MREICELSPTELHRLTELLTVHAWRKMRRLTWRGAYLTRDSSAAKAYQAGDFVEDAVAKALDGRRQWDRQQYPTLETFLRSIIDSDINHAVESADNVHERLMRPSDAGESARAYELSGTEPDPLHVVVDREWRERFRAAALKALEGDTFLIQLFECLAAEITEPADVAGVLEVSTSDVNNAKKRLRRKLDKLVARVKPATKGMRP